ISTVNKKMAIRRWNETLSTPVGEAFGNIDFLRDLPAVLGLGAYLVKDDRTRRKLDPTNHYKFADGSLAALNGSMGQYMWCWNKHYFSWWRDGNYIYEAVSTEPIAQGECYYIPAGGTSAFGAGVMDRTSNLLCSLISDDTRYRGGNNNAAYDGTYRTFLGKAASNITATTFSTYARARGVGWESGWYAARAVQEYLFRVIMGTRHSQAAYNPNKDANGLYQGGLGDGVTILSGTEWSNYNGYYPFIPTSAGIELGDACGEASYNIPASDGASTFKTVKIPVFFGLKNMYGHLWQAVRGIIVDAGAEKSLIYVAPSLYNNYNNDNVTGMKAAGEMARTESYIKKLSMHKLNCLPTEVNGSTSTYYADMSYCNHTSSQGLRCRLAGGSANDGDGAGAGSFASSTNNAVSVASTSISSPLCYFEEDPLMP
ncbi:hypothetical protein EZS27_033924, partial [termite gut metagenome]